MKEEIVKNVVTALNVMFITSVAYGTVKFLKFLDSK